jgi:hypothetical protein
MGSNFNRALSAAFIAKLATEARRDGWWADVLADPKLVVALRGTYLNVYRRGQSLFRVKSTSSGLNVATHVKYLVDPKMASQVTLTDRDFEISRLADKGFIRRYEGPRTIAKMKAAAGLFSGAEKKGCHEIAVRNAGVIDCEIAFPGKVSLDDGGDDSHAPRVDIAALESHGNEARLVFWEAKHYSNGELRAADGSAPVVRQVKIYERYLSENRGAIERSYTRTAENLVSISDMGWKRQLSPLISDVATGKRVLTLGPEPAVGLVIFGFDSAQAAHAGWKTYRERLEREIIRVRTIGDAKNLSLST